MKLSWGCGAGLRGGLGRGLLGFELRSPAGQAREWDGEEGPKLASPRWGKIDVVAWSVWWGMARVIGPSEMGY